MRNTIDVYRQRLKRLAKHPKIAGFLRWWLDELSALLPQGWRSSGPDFSDAAVVRLALPNVSVSRVEKGGLAEIGRMDLKSATPADQRTLFKSLLGKFPGGTKVVIGLPGDAVLLKALTLPLAAEENLEQVLAFEMDRHTPFKAEQVYFDYRILRRDAHNNRLELELAVVPREAVDKPLTQLAGWGVTPIAVTLEEQIACKGSFNLLPRARRPQRASFLGPRDAVLLGLVFVLALGALILPIVIKREAAVQLLPLVERAKHAAEATDVLHRKLDALTAQHNFLLEKKQASPVMIVLFDELTRLLPDDTWVQQLDLKGKELQIMGETASSSKLIGLMEQSRILRDANFRSPLTKGQSPNGERYHLVAEVKPLPVGLTVASQAAGPQPGIDALPPGTEGGKPAQPGDDQKPEAQPQSSQTNQDKD